MVTFSKIYFIASSFALAMVLLLSFRSPQGFSQTDSNKSSAPPPPSPPSELSLDEPPTEGGFPPSDQVSPKESDLPKTAQGQAKSGSPQGNPSNPKSKKSRRKNTVPPADALVQENTSSGETKDSSVTVDSSEKWESFRESDLSPSLEEVTKSIKIEDIVEPPSEYHYAAFGKPDPFKPVTRRNKQNSILPETPIESVEVPILSTLQLVDLRTVMVLGIWQGADGKRKAMVTANTPAARNQSFVVKSGDPIGNRGGVIQSIESDHIKVNEFELLRDGTRQVNKRELPFYLSINNPPENLGSWIFNPGTPIPVQKTPSAANGPAGVQDGGAGGRAQGSGAFLAPGIPQSMFQNPAFLRGPESPLQGMAPPGGPTMAPGSPLAPPPSAPPASRPASPAGGATPPPSAYNPNAGKPPATPQPAAPTQPAPNNTTSPPTNDRKIKAF